MLHWRTGTNSIPIFGVAKWSYYEAKLQLPQSQGTFVKAENKSGSIFSKAGKNFANLYATITKRNKEKYVYFIVGWNPNIIDVIINSKLHIINE